MRLEPLLLSYEAGVTMTWRPGGVVVVGSRVVAFSMEKTYRGPEQRFIPLFEPLCQIKNIHPLLRGVAVVISGVTECGGGLGTVMVPVVVSCLGPHSLLLGGSDVVTWQPNTEKVE